jgi:hypothetical protein
MLTRDINSFNFKLKFESKNKHPIILPAGPGELREEEDAVMNPGGGTLTMQLWCPVYLPVSM